MYTLSELEGGRVALTLRQCSRCNRLVDSMGFRSLDASDSIIYRLLHDKNLKLAFEEFIIMCPVHTSQAENGTFYKFSDEELELMAGTPVGDIWITLE